MTTKEIGPLTQSITAAVCIEVSNRCNTHCPGLEMAIRSEVDRILRLRVTKALRRKRGKAKVRYVELDEALIVKQ